MTQPEPAEARPPNSAEIVQAIPKGGTRSYDEMNTGNMVFELQGTVGELKEAVAALTRSVDRGFDRIETLERTAAEIRDTLRGLSPKIEDLSGFAKHRAPMLADKADLATLRSELTAGIEKRPTRRQSVADIALIVGVISAAIALGAKFAH
jgi:hypothetical protein